MFISYFGSRFPPRPFDNLAAIRRFCETLPWITENGHSSKHTVSHELSAILSDTEFIFLSVGLAIS